MIKEETWQNGEEKAVQACLVWVVDQYARDPGFSRYHTGWPKGARLKEALALEPAGFGTSCDIL